MQRARFLSRYHLSLYRLLIHLSRLVTGTGRGRLLAASCDAPCAAPGYPRGRPQVQRSGLEATFGRGSLKPPFSRWTVLSDSALTPTPLPHNLFQLFMIRGAGRFVKRFLKNRAPDRLKCRRCAPCRWKTDGIRPDSLVGKLRLGELGVGRGGRVDHQALGVCHVGQQGKQL